MNATLEVTRTRIIEVQKSNMYTYMLLIFEILPVLLNHLEIVPGRLILTHINTLEYMYCIKSVLNNLIL